MHRLALGLVLLATACRTGSTPAPPPTVEPTPAPAEDEAAGPSLEEIADAIDPGPRPSLTADLPAWLVDELDLRRSGDSAALLAEARSELERFESVGMLSDDAGITGMVALGRALAMAEQAGGDVESAPVEVLLVLEKVYGMLDLPALANDRNVFGRMLQAFGAALAAHGSPQDSAALDDLGQSVFSALQRSGELHRRTVAALLRRAPDHDEVPRILARLGDKIVDEDDALAVGVLQRSLAMRGSSAQTTDWLDLASMCNRTLRVSCARDALAKAEAVAPRDDEKVAERLQTVRRQSKHAHRALELADAPGLGSGLELAASLYELQRYEQAQEVYERLAHRHPEDSRPVVGLARLAMVDGADFVTAGQILERSAPTEHLDQDWYELTIGVRATAIIYQLLPQIADRKPAEIFELLRPSLTAMRADIDALEALGADEGRVLRFIYDVGMEAWPKVQSDDTGALVRLLRGLLPRTKALAVEVPNSRHAYQLTLAAAEFSDDAALALGVWDAAPPAEHAEELAERRARAAFDMVAAWDAADRVEDMLRLLDELDDPERSREVRRLVVDGHLLARRLGQGDRSWSELERDYRALLEAQGGSTDALVLNNLAVVVAEQGRAAEAIQLWAQAEEHADENARDVPRLNALVVGMISGEGKHSADQLAELRALAESGDAVEVRLQAHAWLVATADGSGRRKARRGLAVAVADESAKNFRPRNLPGKGAVIMRGSMQVGLGYSSLEGMQLELDVAGVPWMVVPCPVPIPDPRKR